MTTNTNSTPARLVPVTLTKIAPRTFRAGVAFKLAPNGIASGEGKTRKTAIRAMEQALRVLGYQGALPTWDVREPSPVAAPVAPAPQPEAATTPAPEPTPAPEVTGDEADYVAQIAEERLAAALEAAPLIPSPAANLRPGKFSPLNGLDFWVAVFLDATARLTDIEFPGETPAERVKNFRDSIDLVMREANCVGAWDRDPSGTPWVTRAAAMDKRVFDPTRRPVRRTGLKTGTKVRTFAGDAWREAQNSPVYAPGNKPAAKVQPLVPSAAGAEVLAEVAAVRAGLAKQASKPEAAEAPAAQPAAEGNVVARAEYEGVTYLKLDSGRWVAAGTDVRPAREIRRVLNQGLMAASQPAPAAPRYTPASDADKLAYRTAVTWGRKLAGAAAAKGEDPKVAYKVGVVAALRAQNAAPNAKFEADLRAAGADEAYFAAQAEAALEWLTTPAAQAA